MSAAVPIHSRCLSGSVRNGQMVSGVASIMISRTSSAITACLLRRGLVLSFTVLGLLGHVAQALEARRPVVVEERAQLRHGVGVRGVQAPRAIAPLGHEAGVLEHR